MKELVVAEIPSIHDAVIRALGRARDRVRPDWRIYAYQTGGGIMHLGMGPGPNDYRVLVSHHDSGTIEAGEWWDPWGDWWDLEDYDGPKYQFVRTVDAPAAEALDHESFVTKGVLVGVYLDDGDGDYVEVSFANEGSPFDFETRLAAAIGDLLTAVATDILFGAAADGVLHDAVGPNPDQLLAAGDEDPDTLDEWWECPCCGDCYSPAARRWVIQHFGASVVEDLIHHERTPRS